MIVTARDMRDLHVDVVDNDGEVIRRISVGSKKNEVIDQLRFEMNVAADEIVKIDRARFDFESNHVWVARNSGQRATTTGVPVRDACALRSLPFSVEIFDGAIASICGPPTHEFLGTLPITREPVALIDRAFIPLDPEPLQGTDNLLRVMLTRALDVGILDPEQHLSAVVPCVQQVKDGCARAAHVQVPGRRGRETEFHDGGHSTIEGPIMSKSRGFTLIEVLVALLILTIVITTTIAMFVERHKRLRQANETILAYQALSNEAEIWRRIGFGQLDAQAVTFQYDTAIIP